MAGVSRQSVDSLSHGLMGEVLVPGDRKYDEARRVFNAMIDRRPYLVIRCASRSDVVKGVEFARTEGKGISLKGGGHSVAGNAVGEDAVMLDLSSMKDIAVDPDARLAVAGPGLTLGEFDQATHEAGLATPTGIVSVTGLSGLALGGGLGWLNGLYGLACDNIVAVEMVTAEGELVRASDEENSDLFWAVRGAGANFGVVTSFEFRLHPVANVYAGGVVYPVDRALDALLFYDEFANGSPDELTMMGAVWKDEDGEVRTSVGACYVGSAEDAQTVLAPLRHFGPPDDDMFTVMPYPAFQAAKDTSWPKGQQHYWKGSSLSKIEPEAAELIVDHVGQMPSLASGVGLQQLHGTAARVDPSATAFPARWNHHDFQITSQWSDPAETEDNVSWTRRLFEAMSPFVDQGVYVNNLGDEGEGRIQEAYGPNYQRLKQLKRKYDPENLFRFNQNIRPGN